MKEYIIDGNKFNDLEEFFIYTESLLTVSFKSGRNLDAFADLLCGGFGKHNYAEPILIKWINYNKSRYDLGIDTTLKILEIMLDYDNSHRHVKVELYDTGIYIPRK